MADSNPFSSFTVAPSGFDFSSSFSGSSTSGTGSTSASGSGSETSTGFSFEAPTGWDSVASSFTLPPPEIETNDNNNTQETTGDDMVATESDIPSGEEMETKLAKIRGKLYIFDAPDLDDGPGDAEKITDQSKFIWKERGIGYFSVNQHNKKPHRGRVIHRADPIGQISINSPIFPDMVHSIEGGKKMKFRGIDDNGEEHVFIIRSKTADDMVSIQEAIDKVIAAIKEHGDDESADDEEDPEEIAQKAKLDKIVDSSIFASKTAISEKEDGTIAGSTTEPTSGYGWSFGDTEAPGSVQPPTDFASSFKSDIPASGWTFGDDQSAETTTSTQNDDNSANTQSSDSSNPFLQTFSLLQSPQNTKTNNSSIVQKRARDSDSSNPSPQLNTDSENDIHSVIKCLVVEPYTAKDQTELSLSVGTNVDVSIHPPGTLSWWKGTSQGKVGWFPSSAVVDLKELNEFVQKRRKPNSYF